MKVTARASLVSEASCFARCCRLQSMREGILQRVRRTVTRHGEGEDGRGAGFAVRLTLSFAATLALVGVLGYLYINHALDSSQMARFAAAQQAYASTFE